MPWINCRVCGEAENVSDGNTCKACTLIVESYKGQGSLRSHGILDQRTQKYIKSKEVSLDRMRRQ